MKGLDLLVAFDDASYVSGLLRQFKDKQVKLVEVPTLYDQEGVHQFLLMNLSSILVIRNPRKDLIQLLFS